jgi:copper resistance protein C
LRLSKFVPVFVVAIFMALLSSMPAMAHSDLVSASPRADEILTIWPNEVVLNFNEELLVTGQQQVNFVSVLDSSGKQIDNRDSKVAGSRVSVSLPSQLANGAYFVNYRVVSADGHIIEDSYEFGFEGEEIFEQPVTISAPIEDGEVVPISADVEPETSPWSLFIVLASVISFGVLIYQMRKNRIR